MITTDRFTLHYDASSVEITCAKCGEVYIGLKDLMNKGDGKRLAQFHEQHLNTCWRRR